MNIRNAAARQDVVENSVDHQIIALADSAASPEQLENLLTSELDHDLIAWPRQYLETYLDSDTTGRVPLDAEQLQDVLEAAFDRDATLAREYVQELNRERRPKSLGKSTLAVTIARSDRKEPEYELLFDPTDSQGLKDLIDKLDMFPWERRRVQANSTLEAQPDAERREATTTVAAYQPGNGALELHDKTTGTDVRKLFGGGEPLSALQLALRQMAPDARVENAQTDSGTYRGRIIGETEKSLIQQITSHSAVVHRKDLLDVIPAVGESVRIGYSNDHARVFLVKERSKTQELGR